MENDPFRLKRFVDAQQASYRNALAELRAGLGSSPMSVRYAIGSLAEARAYLAHPLLGARLRECVAAMNAHAGLSARQILGEIDAMKFRSCLTLFIDADPQEPVFREALDKYFSGEPDAATLAILSGPAMKEG